MNSAQELRLKHLEMIQSVISRLAQNSFNIKGWSITLVSVVFAFLEAQQGAKHLILVTLIPAIAFWVLDAYYLQQERLYRKLYASVAQEIRDGTTEELLPLFTMDTRPYKSEVPSWRKTLFASTTLPIPLILSVIVVLYWLFI